MNIYHEPKIIQAYDSLKRMQKVYEREKFDHEPQLMEILNECIPALSYIIERKENNKMDANAERKYQQGLIREKEKRQSTYDKLYKKNKPQQQANTLKLL